MSRNIRRRHQGASCGPNFDTLYSIAYLDLTNEPWSSPLRIRTGAITCCRCSTCGRMCSPRRVGARRALKAGIFLVTPQGWRPDLRDRFADEFKLPKDTQRIEAPTPYVWIIGRTKTDGPADYDAVHKIQAGYNITPLSNGARRRAARIQVDPSVDMKTPPKAQVDSMSAGEFFAYAAELIKPQPPHVTDQPIIAQMKKIGIEPGKSFDIGKLDPAVQRALESVPRGRAEADGVEGADAGPGRERLVDEYRHDGRIRQLLLETGDCRATRAWRESARGRHLSSQSCRRVRQAARWREQIRDHFRKGRCPPVNAFWSITLYDPEGFQVGNVLNRFAVSSWMPFKYNADGSLDLYFQNENPGKDKKPTGSRRQREGSI